MTLTATPLAAPAAQDTLPVLPEAVVRRLEGLRPHTEGLTPAAVAALLDQAFRNFEGINTDLLVRYLSTPAA